MAFENRNYMIFNVSELDQIDFNQVLETSADTVRLSADGTRTFVKWENIEPECIKNLLTAEGPYTHAEILNIMSSPEWSRPMEYTINVV